VLRCKVRRDINLARIRGVVPRQRRARLLARGERGRGALAGHGTCSRMSGVDGGRDRVRDGSAGRRTKEEEGADGCATSYLEADHKPTPHGPERRYLCMCPRPRRCHSRTARPATMACTGKSSCWSGGGKPLAKNAVTMLTCSVASHPGTKSGQTRSKFQLIRAATEPRPCVIRDELPILNFQPVTPQYISIMVQQSKWRALKVQTLVRRARQT
jgi:hypothetical protein